MSDTVTMVKDFHFPSIDITHKPRRLQSDNILNSGRATEEVQKEETSTFSSIPLHSVTIERAIEYYESNASGELATLYRSTAKWLKELLQIGHKAVVKEAHESESTESATSEVKNDEEKDEVQKGS